ncbi:MAG: NAD(P)/FAD-dependent oxidoreductase [Clostridia bacterium]|nr:NAD(P)/FAD-dependent oxidoreductase [Clostridia bacterium]
MYDIIIIGSGAAGLTAAVYAARAGKTALVIEKNAFGGQITYSPKVENFPTVKQISGSELADRMVDAAIELGTEFEMDTVKNITDNGNTKTVVCEGGSFEGKTVIIAVGVKHRQLGLPRENELIGNGISFCAVCDGAFFSGQDVAVAGGGNSALQEAVYLSEICSHVTVIECMPTFTGEKTLIEKLEKLPNVTMLSGTAIKGFMGEDSLTGLTVEDESGERTISVSGLFVAIGLEPDNAAFSSVAVLDDRGYLVSDESCESGTKGVYIAGDCRKKSIRQLTTACADGTVAALAACRYIDNM